ncbi:hypothetical protein DFQ27_001203 [Actinomortierella ambigua]|uniref:Uncharacterized protein n=1 Tax=Actinomortierella ambigua TaxID=1343610 RepID=A0A9P6QBZ7_9FUNG|nr:hypothetical protein DFQ27_001203 [Actinomortierella ambigua]
MVASGLEQVALALALHTLYLLFTADSQPPDAGEGGASTMLDWALLIDERTKELKDDDLDVVVRAFKTLPNLLVLVRVLDATELYSLAMTLLDRMIDDFSELKRKTSALLDNSDPQTNHITVRTLESMIDDIEQRRLAAAAASGWHYDYDLGHWAQQQKQEEAENSVKSAANGSGSTTSRDRFISILSDDDDDRGDDIDSTRLRPITRSITRNGRRLSLFSSASPRKPPSATPRQRRQLRAAKAIADEDDDGNDDGDDDDDDDIDGDGDGDGDGDVSSDTEMASALLDADWLPSSSSPPRRFSMAHYRRPLRESKRIVCYCTESDDDEEEDRDSDATRHTADGTREEDNYSSDEWDQEASCGPSESISLHSEGSMEEDFEERLVTVTKSDSSSVNDDISMENDSDCEVSSEHSSARRSLSAGSSIPLERAYWSEDDWDEVGSRGVNHFQKVDCTPSSSVSSETDTLMTPTGICSSEDDSDTEFLPPESKEARPVAVSRKRRRRRRGKVSFSDAWSGGTSASASSDGEYCPRAQHSFSARARQARKRRPQVEDELSGISIENAYSHDDGDDSDGDHKMEACMRDHLSRPLVDLSDIDSIEHDDSYHCHDARWEERQEEFSAEMNAAVESPSLVTVSLSGVLKDDASDTDRGDGGEVEDGSQYSASDGSEEADDEEWLPSIRFPKLRPPRRDPSPQHDQPLHLAVGEPLPLTEADELAF